MHRAGERSHPSAAFCSSSAMSVSVRSSFQRAHLLFFAGAEGVVSSACVIVEVYKNLLRFVF